MTAQLDRPRLVKGGIVLMDPDDGRVLRSIPMQYNPETLTRSLAPRAAGEGGDRTEALRLAGPPTETIRVEAELDLVDEAPVEAGDGIAPRLAALEALVYPSSAALALNHRLAMAGTLEIAPASSPLILFVWGRKRVVPVRITEFGIVEQTFDAELNPLRAEISLSLQVLSLNDLDYDHRGASLYLVYQRRKERLADPGSGLGAFGLEGIDG